LRRSRPRWGRGGEEYWRGVAVQQAVQEDCQTDADANDQEMSVARCDRPSCAEDAGDDQGERQMRFQCASRSTGMPPERMVRSVCLSFLRRGRRLA